MVHSVQGITRQVNKKAFTRPINKYTSFSIKTDLYFHKVEQLVINIRICAISLVVYKLIGLFKLEPLTGFNSFLQFLYCLLFGDHFDPFLHNNRNQYNKGIRKVLSSIET